MERGIVIIVIGSDDSLKFERMMLHHMGAILVGQSHLEHDSNLAFNELIEQRAMAMSPVILSPQLNRDFEASLECSRSVKDRPVFSGDYAEVLKKDKSFSFDQDKWRRRHQKTQSFRNNYLKLPKRRTRRK